MFTTDSLELDFDSIFQIEFASGDYLASVRSSFTQNSVEIPVAVELATSDYLYSGTRTFSTNTVEVTGFIPELSPRNYQADRTSIPTFQQSALSKELSLRVLPYFPGDTAREIVWEVSDAIFLTMEDILDVLDYKGDIALIFDQGQGSLNIKQNDLERDAGLETAYLISLFTDARATQEDIEPDKLDGLRGWWADVFADEQGDSTGSFLWLLERSKEVPSLLARAKEYAEKCLQWAIDDGVVKSNSVTVDRQNLEGIYITIQSVKPKSDETVTFKYFYNWQAEELRRVG